jgi:hypothetical protein
MFVTLLIIPPSDKIYKIYKNINNLI